MRIIYLIKDYYYSYKNIIDFNKNIIVSAIVTAICDMIILAVASNIFANNHLEIAILSLVGDFIIFNSLFIFLFYLDWKEKRERITSYPTEWSIKSMILKLLSTLGISEISYLVTKFVSTYLLLYSSSNLDSSQISIITTILAWLLYLSSANIMVRRTKLFAHFDSQK
ncbi:MAG TPA: hypothetical protein VFG45_12450 [Candidatus Nitrosocosmicus sp.]|nr:hypothetical protein [Candidatus Nitrosocosmicus sp.]